MYAAVAAEREQLAAECRRLQERVIALAEALAAATHAYVPPDGPASPDSCDHDYADERDGSVWLCMTVRADPVHQTPDAVLTRLDGAVGVTR